MVARIPLEAAVAKAKAFVADMYRGEGIDDVLLEEVRQTPDSRDWLVTIGFARTKSVSPHFVLHGRNRSYKLVRVDGESGEVKEMTIRTPNGD